MRERSQNERKSPFLETINAFGSILMHARTAQESAWSVAKHAIGKLGYIDCIIYLINDAGELYQCAAHGNKNPTAQNIQNPIKLKIGEGICGYVALTGIGEVIADTSKDPRYTVDDENRYSEITVPVLSDGVVIGIIDSEHPEKGYFSEHDLSILNTIASMLSLKISQVKAIEKLKISEEGLRSKTIKLNEALEKQKELNQLKSDFVSIASHEFRTPLSAINFAAGSMKKYWAKMEPIMIQKKLGKIEDQVMHMRNLLDDMLTIGQAQSGEIKNKPLPVNLGEFIDEIIEEVYSSYKKSHEILLIDREELRNSDIFIDQKVGRNIFINLLCNAIKFSPDADKVLIELLSEENATIISITDYGIGIPKAALKNIFKPFIRGENVDLIQGTGLGLTIVKDSINTIGGKIRVNSSVDKGSNFRVTLPINHKN